MLFLLLMTVKESGAVEKDSTSSLAEFRLLLEEFLKSLNLDFDNFESWLQKASSQNSLLEVSP
jgi:hypothetical protein